MANRYSIGSGLASDVTKWDGGTTVPVSGDRVLITVGTTIELDGAYEWGDDSTSTIVINTVSTNRGIVLRGKLSHSRSVNSSITCRGGFQIDSGGEHDMGTVASPIPQGVVAATYVNKSNASPALGKYNYEVFTGGKFTYVGVFRKRHTVLTAAAAAAATTIFVDDATGWQVGDLLHITGDSAGSHQNVTITGSYTPGSLTVPISAGLTTSKRLNIAVANSSSNVIITSQTTATRGGWSANTSVSEVANSREIRNVAMIDLVGSYPMNSGVLFRCVDNYGGTRYPNPYTSLDSIAFGTTFSNQGVMYSAIGQNPAYLPNLHFTNCAFLHLGASGAGGVAGFGSTVSATGCLFGNVTTSSESNYLSELIDCKIVITNAGSAPVASNAGNSTVLTNCKISGNMYTGAQYSANNTVRLKYIGCDFGVALPTSTGQHIVFQIAPVYSSITFTNCNFAANALMLPVSQAKMTTDSFVKLINKNADQTLQEDWRYNYTAVRSNSETHRGASSIAMKPITAGIVAVRSQEIFCANGASIRLIGYIKSDALFFNGGGSGWYAPTASVSGLGVTTGTVNGVDGVAPSFAGTSSATWEKYDITVTNTSGADGYFSLDYTVNPRVVVTGTVYFDGVTEAPFINRCRHYGFNFDESVPTRIVNLTVGASEATAAGYSGVTVTWATGEVVIGSNVTFQYLYDYIQYQACQPANIPFAVPITGAGVAGSPTLFATTSGNIINCTGYTLNGPGAIVLGDNWLWGSIPFTYQYSGGSFSQAASIPSFLGGLLQIGATGVYTFNMAAPMSLVMTPAGTGTYNLSASTFSGEVDLMNDTAFAITVQLPAGASYTTANNTGGTITVTLPATYQSVTVNGLVVGSRVQIYDLTSNTELANAVAVASTYTWTDSVAASASRAIRLRVAYVSGATAKQFIEASIGTCGTGTGDAAISYLASQTDDAVYIANGIDGSTVTECSIVGTNLFVDVNAGSITISRIYAFMVYWLSTVGGIEDQTTEMVAKDTANYVVNTGFQIRNATTGPTIPLLITGGNIDPATGVATDILDTSGGSIFVNSSIVVPYSTGAGATIAIVQAGLSAQGFTTPVAARIDVAISTRATPDEIDDAQTAINAHIDTQTANLDAPVSSRATAGDIFAAV